MEPRGATQDAEHRRNLVGPHRTLSMDGTWWGHTGCRARRLGLHRMLSMDVTWRGHTECCAITGLSLHRS